jgi:cytochrome c
MIGRGVAIVRVGRREGESAMGHGLARWTAALSIAFPVAVQADGGDPEAGAQVFKLCIPCHSVTDQTRKIGPTLNGVIGRRAGTLPGYKYSGFMVIAGEAGLIWDEAELGDYIADPKGKIPGNSMAFAGLREREDIADVVAYIRKFSPD